MMNSAERSPLRRTSLCLGSSSHAAPPKRRMRTWRTPGFVRVPDEQLSACRLLPVLVIAAAAVTGLVVSRADAQMPVLRTFENLSVGTAVFNQYVGVTF